jgi:hypothetical protein
VGEGGGDHTLVSEVAKADIRAGIESCIKRSPKPPGRGGGRRPKYNWENATVGLFKRLQDDGVPVEGDGGQANLERFVAGFFAPDCSPAPSVIRAKVRSIIEAFRRSLNESH